MSRKRFGKQDWLVFGLQQLARHGPDALKLAALCQAAGRTTGSFYYHFRDQAEFLDQMLAHWQATHTEAVIAEVTQHTDPKEHAKALSETARGLDPSVEVAVRLLAQQNDRAAAVLRAVDAQRMDHLGALYQQTTGLAEGEARALADLEYAAFVGAQMLWQARDPDRLQQLEALFQDLLRSYLQGPAADAARSDATKPDGKVET